MSALPTFFDARGGLATRLERGVATGSRADVAAVLLGTGVVGGALLRLLATPHAERVRLVGVANSTRQFADADGFAADVGGALLGAAPCGRDDRTLLEALDRSGASRRVVIDATASDRTASHHANWLAAGYDVVTANKAAAAGAGGIDEPFRPGATHRTEGIAPYGAWALRGLYGDAATVGAGLPVLATVRRLCACGDAPIAIEGVFSGSLSWLFNQYDGSRPFSALLREAHAFGYTEPDPRLDLGGVDVVRKLVILARAAGRSTDVGDVECENLVPVSLRECDVPTFLARADELDATIEAKRVVAASAGHVLRHVAALDADSRACVGLVAVPPEHPMARLAGTDNLFALTSERYRVRPLVIQGPGAGAEVTAQALLGDLLALPTTR